MTRKEIIEAIAKERQRQQDKHGEWSVASPFISDGDRLAILIEEVGEVGKAMQEHDPHSDSLRAELVQVAAVCVAWLEAME